MKNGFRYAGVGTTLSVISTLVDNNIKQVCFDNSSLANSLLKCFNITKSSLFAYDTDKKCVQADDVCKFFSPYVKPKFIRYKGRNLEIKNKSKPCVGFTMYHMDKGLENPVKELTNSYPDYKFHPISVNLHLSKVLIEAGYDIIMLDSLNMPLEDKVYLMNEYCDVIIGYEGGVHHLAHSLGIPSIILPHRTTSGSRDCINMLHLDSKTYFLSKEEMLELSVKKFLKIRKDLLENKGNNIFLDPKNKIGLRSDLKSYKIHFNGNHSGQESKFNFSIINNIAPVNLETAKIGGIKKFYTYDN
jgi:hypothetical protein